MTSLGFFYLLTHLMKNWKSLKGFSDVTRPRTHTHAHTEAISSKNLSDANT